jgi:hypothetical protein
MTSELPSIVPAPFDKVTPADITWMDEADKPSYFPKLILTALEADRTPKSLALVSSNEALESKVKEPALITLALKCAEAAPSVIDTSAADKLLMVASEALPIDLSIVKVPCVTIAEAVIDPLPVILMVRPLAADTVLNDNVPFWLRYINS